MNGGKNRQRYLCGCKKNWPKKISFIYFKKMPKLENQSGNFEM